MKFAIAVLFALWVYPAAAQSNSPALSLTDCYKKALERSERIEISVSQIARADANYKEALSAIYPKLNFQSSERYKSSSNSGSSSFSSDSTSSGGDSRSDSSTRFDVGVSVTQPIFTGFRNFILIQASKADLRGKEYEAQRTKEVIYLGVAESFHQILLYDGALQELEETLQILEERTNELTERVTLGKSRESEVLSAKAGMAETAAALEITKGLLAASKETLAFLTGLSSDSLSLLRAKSPPLLGSLQSYLEQGVKRSDVLAAQERKFSTEKQLLATHRERWPTVSLQGSYYPYVVHGEDDDWSLLGRLEFPIFDGGAISARVAEQEEILREATLSLSELNRIVERDTRIAFSNLLSSQRQVEKLRESVKSSDANYKSQKKDYNLGVVNNIEVLQSIRQLHDVRRELLQAEANVEVNRARLEVASGGVPS